jgi:hypothetical protein
MSQLTVPREEFLDWLTGLYFVQEACSSWGQINNSASVLTIIKTNVFNKNTGLTRCF